MKVCLPSNHQAYVSHIPSALVLLVLIKRNSTLYLYTGWRSKSIVYTNIDFFTQINIFIYLKSFFSQTFYENKYFYILHIYFSEAFFTNNYFYTLHIYIFDGCFMEISIFIHLFLRKISCDWFHKLLLEMYQYRQVYRFEKSFISGSIYLYSHSCYMPKFLSNIFLCTRKSAWIWHLYNKWWNATKHKSGCWTQ